MLCNLCPRACGVDRKQGELGICGQGSIALVSRAALHFFEEPAISGTRGSGTIFFTGCSLGCVFCQNREISRGESVGTPMDRHALAETMLRLQEEGAHNINLVTPTHFADRIAETLSDVRGKLRIPVVYNSSGYENLSTLQMLDGLIDIYLPDFKYASAQTAERYSAAPDYPEIAECAVVEMVRQAGGLRFDENGILQRGVIVRLLVLPGERKDAMEVLHILSRSVSPSQIKLSLMSQYTPEFAMDTPYPNLHRRLTSFEYNSVWERACELGFEGYSQARESASARYTPDFSKNRDVL